MLVEALVLDIDGALQHIGRDLVLGDAFAVLRVEACDLVAVAIEDRGGLRNEILARVGVIGQVLQPFIDVADHADTECHSCDQEKAEEGKDDKGDGMRLGTAATVALARTHGDLQIWARRT